MWHVHLPSSFILKETQANPQKTKKRQPYGSLRALERDGVETGAIRGHQLDGDLSEEMTKQPALEELLGDGQAAGQHEQRPWGRRQLWAKPGRDEREREWLGLPVPRPRAQPAQGELVENKSWLNL